MLQDLDRGGCMNNLNSILIVGNLVRDPLLRSTPNITVLIFKLSEYRIINGYSPKTAELVAP
jgi:single-stranded DNA-binding protein